MGWWGTTIFGGDTPCDFEHDIERMFEKVLEETLKKSDYYEGEHIPALFIAADFVKHFTRRADILRSHIQKLEKFAANPNNFTSWKNAEERQAKVQRFVDYLKHQFNFDETGYDYKNDASTHELDGKRVYHLMLAKHIYSIRQTGLNPQAPSAGFLGNMRGVYVSASIVGCMKWIHHVTSHDPLKPVAIVSFEVRPKDNVVRDLRVDFMDDYRITHGISPKRLTIME
jgi:hypothetical protein